MESYNYNYEQWTSIIRQFIFEKYYSIDVAIGRDDLPDDILCRIYGLLSEKEKNIFSKSLSAVFESVQPSHAYAEQLYYLIQIITYVRPIAVKQKIREYLFNGVLENVKYEGQLINTMLLNLCCKYFIDEELIEFMKRLSSKSNNYLYSVISFRALTGLGPIQAVPFIGLLLPHLKTKKEMFSIEDDLNEMLIKFGFREMYFWYTDNRNILQKQFPAQWNNFVNMLKQILTEADDELSSIKDPYQSLLFLLLIIPSRKTIEPEEVLHIARLSKQIDMEIIRNSLKDIRETLKLISRKSLLWEYNPHSDQFGNAFRDQSLSSIRVGTKSVEFNRLMEPTIDEMLESVSGRIN